MNAVGVRGYRAAPGAPSRIHHDALLSGPVTLGPSETRLRPVLALVTGSELPPGATPGEAERAVGAVFAAIEFTAEPGGTRYALGERAVELPPAGPVSLWQSASGADAVDTHLPEDFGDPVLGLAELASRVHGLRPGAIAVLGSSRPGTGLRAEPGTVHLQGPGYATVVVRILPSERGAPR